ncbi:MAG: ABC transporter permease [Oscillospiraceae bacterium]|nr:ABC transporter permease [Oscillospiraceae bacterium]
MNKKKLSSAGLLDRYGSIAVFTIMYVVLFIMIPVFRTPSNMLNILGQSIPTLLIALGMTFVNISGEADLSMGGVVGLCATLFCSSILAGHSYLYATLLAFGAGIGFGVVNGILVAYCGLSSFITTISIMFLTKGLEYAVGGGKSFWVRDDPVTNVVTAKIGEIPYYVIVSLLIFVIVYLFLHRTKTGLHFQAVGISADAAKYAGINVKLIKFSSFVVAGLFYSMGALINALRTMGAQIYAGERLLLPVFAVTFIAKTILGSKRPNAPGILIGALVLTIVSNAFTLLGLQFYWTYIAQGLILIVAAIIAVSDRSVILQDNLN